MIDRWDVICTGLRYGNTDTEKLWFWQAVKDPGAKSGSGQYAPGFYVFADEGESGDYGRTAEISVTAEPVNAEFVYQPMKKLPGFVAAGSCVAAAAV